MPVTTDQFLDSISTSGILSAEEVTKIRAGLTTLKAPIDPQKLAQELVKTGKLTKFQAQAIYQGKAKGLVCGDYVFLDKIGVGGMGQVFKARHKRMNRIVAIKILAPQATVGDKSKALQRFQQEVETAAKLLHPNIVTAYDANEAQGLSYLVMEYVPGQDLHTSLKPDKKLPLDQVLDIVIQAARGLEYAHSQGVVHRDIKPANLLVNAKGQVKVLDMGLARVADTLTGADRAATDGLTQTGEVMGTVDYMAPEQARNTREADGRSDIYSLGCTLYRLATGRIPFEESTLVKKFLAHLEKPVPQLSEHCPGVSIRTQHALERMMAKKPEHRFGSMTEVVAELEACRAGVPQEEHSPLVTDEPFPSTGGSSFLNKPGGTGLTHRLPPIPAATSAGEGGEESFSDRRAARAEAATKAAKRRMVLIIGGIAAALILAVVNVVVFLGGREEQNQTVPALAAVITPPENDPAAAKPESTASADEKQPATTAASAPTTSPPPPQATVTPLTPQETAEPVLAMPIPPTGIDMLRELDLKREGAEAGWFRDGSALLKADDGAHGRIQFNLAPPPEYDLYVDVQTQTNRSSFGVGLVAGNSRTTFIMSHVQTGLGLSDVNGKRHYMAENPTHRRDALGFGVNKPMELIFRVRPGSINVLLNDRPIVEWTGDPQELTGPAGGPDKTKLYVVANGNVRFTRYHLLPPGATPMPKPPDPSKVVVNRTGLGTDELQVVSAARDSLTGGWRVDADGLTQVPASAGPERLELPIAPPPEYELQVVALPLMPNNGLLQVGLVVGQARASFSLDRGLQSTGLEPVQGKNFKENPTHLKHLDPWERHEPLQIVCRVKPNAVHVNLNGQRVVTWQGDYRDLSMARNSGDHTKLFIAGAAGGGNTIGSFKFTRISVVPLGVEAKPVPPEPAIAAVSTIVVDRLATVPATATAEERAGAICKLHQDAADAQDEALRFVLLNEAIKLAAASEQIGLLTRFAADLQRSFAVDATATFAAHLAEITARNRPPLERKELAFDLLESAANELDAERFNLCGILIKAASDAAAKTPDLELKKEIRNRELEAEAWQKLFAPVESARQTLVANPADNLANYQLGAYLATRWKFWPAALQLLSKGSHDEVKAAAESEVRLRHDPSSAGVIGGLWLDAAEATELPERAVYLDHARGWLTLGVKRLKQAEQARLSGKFKKLDADVRRTAGTAFLLRHPLRSFQFGGHWYEFVRPTASWREARARCEARGGQLVSLESPAESQAIYQLAATKFEKPDTFGFWLGATEEGHDKQFLWTTGAPVTFGDWASGQPGKESGEAVLAARTAVGSPIFKWQDEPPTEFHTYVCEWDR